MRGTIRDRAMWALFMVGGLAALIVGAVTMYTMAAEIHRQVEVANKSRATALARHVHAEISLGQRLLETVAEDPATKKMEPGAMDQAIGHAVNFNPIFHSIYAYDAAENVVLRRYGPGQESSAGRSRTLGEKRDTEFVELARATMRDGRSRLLPVRLSPANNLFVPCLTAVPGEGGKFLGVLSGAISAAGLGFREMIQGLAPGRRGYVVLLDGEQRVLAATNYAPGKVGEVFPHPIDWYWGQPAVLHPRGVDLAARVPVKDVGIDVLVALPRDEALDVLPQALFKVLAASLAALALAGVFGFWLSERLTEPVNELLDGIRKLGDGILTHRLDPQGEDELAEVGRAFNKLAESLARNRMIEEFWAEPGDVPAAGAGEAKDESRRT